MFSKSITREVLNARKYAGSLRALGAGGAGGIRGCGPTASARLFSSTTARRVDFEHVVSHYSDEMGILAYGSWVGLS